MSTSIVEMQVGDRLKGVSRLITVERINGFSANTVGHDTIPAQNIHNDPEVARSRGFGGPVAWALQSVAYLSQMLVRYFGEGWVEGGKLSVSFIKQVLPGDTLTTVGVIKERVEETSQVRFVLDVWCENQRGEKATVGTAAAILRRSGH